LFAATRDHVAQVRPLVDHFIRGEGNTWTFQWYEALEETVTLPAINVAIPLTETYEEIEWNSG
jgi:hypothetical protein